MTDKWNPIETCPEKIDCRKTPMSEEWIFKPTFKFDLNMLVEPVEGCVTNMSLGSIVKQGQRTKKNRKGETVFDCNSYFVQSSKFTLHYFLEEELQAKNIF